MSSFIFSLAISRIETLRDDEREKNIYRKAPSAFLTAEKLQKITSKANGGLRPLGGPQGPVRRVPRGLIFHYFFLHYYYIQEATKDI